jgi:hypothetical protein
MTLVDGVVMTHGKKSANRALLSRGRVIVTAR